jgi:transposase InsO family protein
MAGHPVHQVLRLERAVRPANKHNGCVPQAFGSKPRRSRRSSTFILKAFEQPTQPHEHWHIDISYINIIGTFYYVRRVLDGSRVYWDLRESMKEVDIEIILERATERYPEAKPRIISDKVSQFRANDFREFIRALGMKHVRTSLTIRNRTASWSTSTNR